MSLFVLPANWETVSHEISFRGSRHFNLVGTRAVIIVPLNSLATHLNSKEGSATKLQLKTVKEFMKEAQKVTACHSGELYLHHVRCNLS